MFDNFSVVFLSILLEALPFVIIGTLVSSLIEVYVSPDWLSRKLSGERKRTYFIMGLMGCIFPICECAIVPIVRRLIKKGMPKGLAITFMLSVPIVNPVVLFSTYHAFPSMPWMVALRGGLGYLGAIIIGWHMDVLSDSTIERQKKEEIACCSHCHQEGHDHHSEKNAFLKTMHHLLTHLSSEIYEVGRFLIIGALLSTSMQIFVPREWLLKLGGQEISSIILMMLLAFVLSLCSEADAFIASTFRNQFSTGSLVAFLIFGPMIDIKNTMMLIGSFKTKFVLKLIVTISVVCFLLSYMVNLLM